MILQQFSYGLAHEYKRSQKTSYKQIMRKATENIMTNYFEQEVKFLSVKKPYIGYGFIKWLHSKGKKPFHVSNYTVKERLKLTRLLNV